MKKVLAFVAMAVGLVLGASAGTVQAYPPSGTVTIPAVVAPGASFSGSATGLTPGTLVTVTIVDSSNTQVSEGTQVTVDANGVATFTLTAPTAPGTYKVVIPVFDGDGNIIDNVTAFFEVRADGGMNKPNKPNKPGTALPSTGSSSAAPFVSVGLAALVAGAGLVFVSKRRRPAAA